MKLYFLTKSKVKGQPATLYIRLRHGRGIDLVTPSGVNINPEFWSNKSQNFRQRVQFQAATRDDTNRLLDEIRDKINKAFNNASGQGVPITKEWLKSILLPETPTVRENLLQFLERFIKEIESGERLYFSSGSDGGRKYTKLTVKVFKEFKTQLKSYLETKHKRLDFDDINIDFYRDFVNFFTAKNCSPNTIGRHIKNLKTIMRASLDEKLHTNTGFQHKDFKVLNIKTEKIYLTNQEINNMFKLDLSDKKHLEAARDVFVVGCHSAQRFSDYSQINSEMIKTLPDENRIISLIQKKTGTRVAIPLHWQIESILNKYEGKLPKIWESDLNEYIKRVGGMAKIKDYIEIETIKGGVKKRSRVPKNELITSHTARRSAITNMDNAGVPLEDIALISGHQDIRQLKNYIKSSIESRAMRVIKNEYFNNKKAI